MLMEIHYETGLFFIALYISYWSVKVFEWYFYVLKSYIKLLKMEKREFQNNSIIESEWKKLQHVIIIPIYTEPYDVIEEAVLSVIHNEYQYKENLTILLATESRAPNASSHANKIIKELGSRIRIINIIHPDNLPNEGRVKWANITYAMKAYEQLCLNSNENSTWITYSQSEWFIYSPLDPENSFISSIDTDTKVEKRFFSIVTERFLSTDERHRAIYQYTPIYSNNWHEGTFFARIIAAWTTMWQFFESQNPEFYRNFAVYGQSLLCLHKADYWDKYSIVEDGMQYWRSYFWWGGKFRIIHTPAICEMDLVDETSIYRTVRSQYKQLRRWSWGCTDVEYVIPKFKNAKHISFFEKIRKTTYLIYNHLFWAGGPFMLFFIGYVPGIFVTIDHSLAAFTVPIASSIIFTILFATIAFPSFLSIHIMRKFTRFRWYDYIFNILQWAVVPVLTLTLFSIPAIESQIRLFLGFRIDSFETTQKMKRK